MLSPFHIMIRSKAMKQIIWCLLILPMFAGDAIAGDKFFSIGANAGIALPEKAKPYGGSVSYRDALASLGVSYNRLSADSVGVNMIAAEAGCFVGSAWYARPHVTLGFLWGEGKWKLDWGGGLELGRSLEFVDFEGLERVAVSADYLPDEFDSKTGGHGGDVMITGRVYLDFEF